MRRPPPRRRPEARLGRAPQDGEPKSATDVGPDRQRLDKWLWHARMVRTRADAAALAQAGHVRVNGKRMKAAGHPVRLGDVLTVALDRSVRVVEVAAFGDRRGPAPAARALYRDLTAVSRLLTSASEAESPKVPPRPGNSC